MTDVGQGTPDPTAIQSRTLVICAHVGEQVAPDFVAAAAGSEVRCFVENGLSSAYHALAARIRGPDGRILPALLKHVGASGTADDYDRVIYLSWSAGYGLAEDILAVPADAAVVTAWVALDSGYGEPTPGVVAFAKRARDAVVAYFAGYTDVPTVGYLSSGGFLDKVIAEAGAPAGNFRVDHWAHDPAALAAAHDQGAYWRAEHIAALHHGPAMLADVIQAIDGASPAPDAATATPGTSNVPSVPDPLAMGATGAAVEELQRLLLAAGASPKVTVDGKYGPLTRAAVAQTQAAYRVQVTGDADAAFLATLRAAVTAAPTDPAPGASLGARALAVAERELAAGVCEVPKGSNRGPQVDAYLAPTGLVGAPWCAAFESWCRRQALSKDEANLLGYNASVFHLWEAAEHAGLARAPGAYTPKPGDAAIWRRDGQDPRTGGEGQVGRVRTAPDGYGSFTAIEGNEDDAVSVRTHSIHDPDLCGWIEEP